jgi:hypothetical protein
MNQILHFLSAVAFGGTLVSLFLGDMVTGASLFAVGTLLLAWAEIRWLRHELDLYRKLRFMRVGK